MNGGVTYRDMEQRKEAVAEVERLRLEMRMSVAAEREACAALARSMSADCGASIAAAIRARGAK